MTYPTTEQIEKASVHPPLRIIPVEWEYATPSGLFHSPKPSKTVQNFLEAVKKVTSKV